MCGFVCCTNSLMFLKLAFQCCYEHNGVYTVMCLPCRRVTSQQILAITEIKKQQFKTVTNSSNITIEQNQHLKLLHMAHWVHLGKDH